MTGLNNDPAHDWADSLARENKKLRLELERLTRERDAIALMWFRELADTAPGEERLYDLVGPGIYTGIDDAGAIGAARRAAGLGDPPAGEPAATDETPKRKERL